ncbi:hypothetical protein D5S17_13825 [Pseudonocardiaceae bacterium YIM PH 21723]|nr:hypothetical protein D5S17_13825 [Pseudonocardiaceae bacterium YIM PH 21723]
MTAVLIGCVITELRRDGLGFRDVSHRLRIDCPLRVTRGAEVLVGSYDTDFDTRATVVAGLTVLTAEVSESGDLTLELTDSVRLHVFPACSGPMRPWRIV